MSRRLCKAKRFFSDYASSPFFQVVPNAVREWQRALNVKKRVANSIKLNRKCRNNQYFLLEEDPEEQVIN